MAIPAVHRELVVRHAGSQLISTYNPFEGGSLWLFPTKAWESVRDQVMALPSAKAIHRTLQMKLVGAATPVEIDGSGRLLVPPSQRNAVGIEKRAVLLGMGERLELWGEQAHLAKVRETVDEAGITAEMQQLRF